MAQVDTSIYNALLQRPKSAFEWQNDYAAQDDAAQARQVNALVLRDTQAKLADAEAARRRNALAISGVQGLGVDATPEAIAGVYQRQGLVDQADKVLKSYTDREKERAATLKTSGETVDAALTRYRAMMDRVQSPQEAAQLLTAQYSDPVLGPLMLKTHGPLEAILPRIPTDPQGFAQYRGAAAQGMAAFQEKVAQKPTAVDLGDRKVMIDTNPNSPTYMKVVQENRVGMSPSEQSQAVNRELVIGPDGQPRVNQPYVDARASVARAGVQPTLMAPITVQLADGTQALYQPGNKPGQQGQIVKLPTGETPRPVTKPAAPLPNNVVKGITEVRDNAEAINNLNESFKPNYAGKGVLGIGADAQMSAAGVVGADKDAVEWWKNYRKQAELVERHALFGAALTPGEQASWRSADIGPGMDPDVIKRNLETRANLSRKVLDNAREDAISAGHDAERVTQIANRTAKPANKAPKSGDVIDGYRFKGGNPADKANWERM